MIERRQPARELGAFLGLVIHGRCDNKKLKLTSNAEYHENDNFKYFANRPRRNKIELKESGNSTLTYDVARMFQR
jgi:hypothetical protein